MKANFEELIGQSLYIELAKADTAHLPAGHTTRWRTMPYFMFSQAWEGSERIYIEDGRRMDAVEGQMVLLPAGIRHKVDVTSATESRHWAHVNYTVAHGVDLFTIVECPVLVERSIGIVVGETILEWVRSDHGRNRTTLERAAAHHELGARLLSLIAPLCRLRADAMDRMDHVKRLSAAIRHMHANSDRPLRRNELAEMASLSPAQFHVVFRSLMGTTPLGYLRDLRLRRAQHLLIATTLPIKEVASRCGYEDPFVFCKFFTRSSGQSPSEYRRSVRP